MPRFKLTIEYDGGPFRGWQRNGDDCPTIQAALEAALLRITQSPTEVTAAGRTDAGVHALGQVAHVDVEKPISPFKLGEAINAQLRPDPIAVVAVEKVDDAFHARFSAFERVYWYRIVNRRADLSLDRGRAWRIGAKLDDTAMHEAARALIGKHDFSTFRDAQCQANSPIRTLDRLDVSRVGEEVHIWTSAQSFLHRQVRSMVGTLVNVGRGYLRPDGVANALAAANRAACGPVAPPEGLYLARVGYRAAQSERRD
ncbi:MAG: tRNA pseudouridine(38-40) synthase TruA [Caulobacterales bacterium]